MVPANLVHIVVGRGRGMWDRKIQANPSMSKCIPPRGIGVTLSPLPPFPVEAFSWRMLKNMRNIKKTHIIRKILHSICVLKVPQLPPVGSFTISLCFTVFLCPWRPNLVNYVVYGPFGPFPRILQCFLVLGACAP